MKVGLGIVCKPPRRGLSKTRLAADIGAEAATRLSAAFLEDVVGTAARVAALGAVDLFCFYRPEDAEAELKSYFPPDVPMVAQFGDDLGEMMLGALTEMFPGRHGAMVVGADVPLLTANIIRDAATALTASRPSVVIGPSEDGGYYLIGATDRGVVSPLLRPMPWSTADVYRLTAARAEVHGVPLKQVDELSDVDDAVGLRKLMADLRRLPGSVAPATRAALAALQGVID